MKKCILVYLMPLIDHGLNETFYKHIFVLTKHDSRVQISDLVYMGFLVQLLTFIILYVGLLPPSLRGSGSHNHLSLLLYSP